MASDQKMQEKNLIQNLISQWKIGDQFRFSKIFQISDSMGYPNAQPATLLKNDAAPGKEVEI